MNKDQDKKLDARKTDVIVVQIYIVQFNRSSCIFEGIFEELEIINDTKMQLSHQNWTLRDHQRIVRTDISILSKWVLLFSLEKNN